MRRNLVASQGLGAAAVALLGDGELDTLALGQGDPGLLGADDEDVGLTGGEGVVDGVLDVDDVETSVVALTVGDDTDTTHVATTGDHGDGAGVELDEVLDLASLEVNLDGVVDLDEGVRVADAVNRHWLANSWGRMRHYQPSDVKFWCGVRFDKSRPMLFLSFFFDVGSCLP